MVGKALSDIIESELHLYTPKNEFLLRRLIMIIVGIQNGGRKEAMIEYAKSISKIAELWT